MTSKNKLRSACVAVVEAMETRRLLSSGSVTGTIYNDLNGDGVHQSNEPALSGRVVFADLNNDGIFSSGEPSTQTNSTGVYTLNGVPYGSAIIRQLPNGGERQSFPIGGAGQHVTIGQAKVTGANFDVTTHLYVSGYVYTDANGNGIKDPGEAGLANVVVYADVNNDGSFQSTENSKLTAADGSFTFVSLNPGSYSFRVVSPAGYSQTVPLSNAGIAAPTAGGAVAQNVIFGLSKPSTGKLTGTVIGTSGSYNNTGNTAAKAFDGNLSTYFDAPVSTGAYTGLDLGSAKLLNQISYAPRSGWASRMVGGQFQASNSADFSSGVATLYTVNTTPVLGSLTTVSINNPSAYRYVRYVGPANSYCDVSEVQFFGTTPVVGATLRGDGTLIVNGTAGADTITVTVAGQDSTNPDTVGVKINGAATQYFVLAGVLRIVVNAGAGDDSVSIAGYDEGPSDQTGHGYEAITVNGGDGTDQLSSTLLFQGIVPSQSVVLDGGSGDDLLLAYSDGYATVVGGDGNDVIRSSGYPGLNLSIYGGNGNDTYQADGDTRLVLYDGGSGVNTLDLYTGMYFSNANGPTVDLRTFVNVHNVITSGVGDLNIIGTSGNDTITGNEGTDNITVVGNGGFDTVSITNPGTAVIDVSADTSASVTLQGAFEVTVIGSGGDDTIHIYSSSSVASNGQAQTASITGGGGNDTIIGEANFATVDGGSGNDTISFIGFDALNLSGGDGNDNLTGEGGALVINGGSGDDTIKTVAIESDQYTYMSAVVNAGDGNDTINTRDGDVTTVDGGSGTDTAYTDPTDSVTNVENLNPDLAGQKLSGTVIGTAGSYNNTGNTAAKAFDGNLTTYFDAPVSTGAYTGLDLGSAKLLNQISYAPRSGWASRMVGGQFQGSNSADFSSGVATLYTVNTTPVVGSLTTVAINNPSAYRYVRYIGPASSFCDVAEIQFLGTTPVTGATLRADGTLMVNGTGGDDIIDVVVSTSDTMPSNQVGVTINGGAEQLFSLPSVLGIVVNAGAGNDFVTLYGIDEGAGGNGGSHGLEPVTINGGDGSDQLTNYLQQKAQNITANSLVFDGGAGNDTFFDSSESDATMIGGDGDDLFTASGNPGQSLSIYGGDGNDTYEADFDTGLQVYDGGSGVNTLDISGAPNGDNSTAPVDLRQFVNVHNLIIGSQSTTIIGTSGNDTVSGGGGPYDYTIVGNGGDDTINLVFAYDVLIDESASTSTDVTITSSNDVTVIGGSGNDTFHLRGNKSVNVDGGAGIDTAYTDPGAVISHVEILNPDYASQKLTGPLFGTSGSYKNNGNTIAKAFDGNLSTYFDGPIASGDVLGQDFGGPKIITQISFAPRATLATRMVGGIFQGSNTADFSTDLTTLYTITQAPADGVLTSVSISAYEPFRYVR